MGVRFYRDLHDFDKERHIVAHKEIKPQQEDQLTLVVDKKTERKAWPWMRAPLKLPFKWILQ